MAKVSADARQRYLMEAHEKYLHDLASARGSLKRTERELRKAKREIREQKRELEAKDQELEELRRQLALKT